MKIKKVAKKTMYFHPLASFTFSNKKIKRTKDHKIHDQLHT